MTKKWKVRGGCVFISADGKQHYSQNTVFTATEAYVAHHRDFIEEVKEKPPEVERVDMDPVPPRRRGRPPKRRVAFQSPPNDKAM